LNALIDVNGLPVDTATPSQPIDLDIGENLISVRVVNQGAPETEYRIIVTREPTYVIDSTVGWGFSTGWSNFGDAGNVEVFGQTFVPRNGAPVLDSISFWLWYDSDPGLDGQNLDFTIEVRRWGIDRASGPALYVSSPQTITPAQSVKPLTEYKVLTGGLILAPGQKYVVYLKVLNASWNATPTAASVGDAVSALLIPDGRFWWISTDNDDSLITGQAWVDPGDAELAMVMVFSVAQ